MPGSAHPPPHIARTQRSSAGAHHAATSRQVITNEWTYVHVRDNRPGDCGWPGRPSRVVPPYREPLQAGSCLSPQIPSESNFHAVFE